MVERAVCPHLSSFTFGRLGGRFCLREPPPQDCRTYLLTRAANTQHSGFVRHSGRQELERRRVPSRVSVAGYTFRRCDRCRCCPLLRLARADTVLSSSAMLTSLSGPLRVERGVRKGFVQRTVSAARGSCDQSRRKLVSIDPYDKIITERGLSVHSRP
jgi:hypothetical protein